MSCYDKLKDTYTKQADLRMSVWDPYPEFRNQPNCNLKLEHYSGGPPPVAENFCNPYISMSEYGGMEQAVSERKMTAEGYDSGTYLPLGLTGMRFPAVLPNIHNGMAGRPPPFGVTENYNQCCSPYPYNNINQTWGPQKPYST